MVAKIIAVGLGGMTAKYDTAADEVLIVDTDGWVLGKLSKADAAALAASLDAALAKAKL